MPSTLRIIAIVFGVAAVIVGVIHGYYETQQGSVEPSSIFINAIGGTECEPNCLPAMTIIPNFLAAGVATIIVGAIMIGWVVVRLKDRGGGIGLILFSIIILLTGGGFLAPILGVVGGAIGLFIKKE